MENNYNIIARTDGYTASRDANFKGKTEVVIASNLTLKEARKKLLDMFNSDYECYCPNWGIAVNMRRNKVFGASSTFSDGTRAYEYDGRRYSIEVADNED